MKPAAAYIRVSSTGQLDGDGPERQRDACRQFARNKRYCIERTFIEDISGTKDSTNRPKWSAMLEWCVDNDVHTVIVEKVDRLARDLLVGELLLQQCRQIGITVLDAASGQDLTDESDDPTVVLLRQVMLAVSQYEKSALVLKLRAARNRKKVKTRGKCEGRKGYADTEQGRRAIRRARSLRDAGQSYRAIADTLQREGHQTASGGAWKAGTVHGMIG